MATCAQSQSQRIAVRSQYGSSESQVSQSNYPPTVAYWQSEVTCRGLYSGPSDGVWGPNSRKAVQQDLKNRRLYSGPVDGDWGSNTWKAIQRDVRVTQDGVPGPITWRALYAYKVLSHS
ncbi:peptidoglycan-binding protein [Pseudoclavibacter sp. Z016]|uniref:peptidoglycan-binding domain-containing protein n=1 Tax=Pseudoclavibacter sp. Z016 TaxID=2080581 RepID=UPI000CE7B65B|nr:peptidoglycan-binding domain-containing protein [Pseudoclavibacter sp. Z016]PPF72606.1 hypothetical protein C5B99_17350 [Pseudoclavibacter sp. Z016]